MLQKEIVPALATSRHTAIRLQPLLTQGVGMHLQWETLQPPANPGNRIKTLFTHVNPTAVDILPLMEPCINATKV